MAEGTTDWDLLSNGSGSDVYWPDSEFDDTVSLLESLSFTDSEEEGSASRGEIRRVTSATSMITRSKIRMMATRLIMTKQGVFVMMLLLLDIVKNTKMSFAITPEDFTTPSDNTPAHTPPVQIDRFPQRTASSSESTTSGKTCTASEIMDRMTTLIEKAISLLIEMLNSPQILSEKDFVIRLLDDFEWDCTNLRENAHPRTQLVEKLDTLLSKIVECVTSIGNRETLAAPSSSSSLSQSEIPEWRRHPEPPATPTARRTDEDN